MAEISDEELAELRDIAEKYKATVEVLNTIAEFRAKTATHTDTAD